MRWIVLFAFLFLGCAQGISSQAARYLKDSGPFQQGLSGYQEKLKEIPALPPEQRQGRANTLREELRRDREKLAALKPPPSVEKLHQELSELYRILDEFVVQATTSSGLPSDPKLQALAKEWSQHLKALQEEVQRLESPR